MSNAMTAEEARREALVDERCAELHGENTLATRRLLKSAATLRAYADMLDREEGVRRQIEEVEATKASGREVKYRPCSEFRAEVVADMLERQTVDRAAVKSALKEWWDYYVQEYGLSAWAEGQDQATDAILALMPAVRPGRDVSGLVEALEMVVGHISLLGIPINKAGEYDEYGEWSFEEACPHGPDAEELKAALDLARSALSTFKGGEDE